MSTDLQPFVQDLAARIQRRPMSRPVDAPRQSADNRVARARQIAGGAGIAGASVTGPSSPESANGQPDASKGL